MKTFVVTGCNGYIGSHMCHEPNTMKTKPPAPQTGRDYIWVEQLNSWVDTTPKQKHLVTFVRVGKEYERICFKDS